MLGRRAILAGLLPAQAPNAAWAQPRRPRRIGYLHPVTLAPGHPTLAILRPQWARLGYVEGNSLFLRSAEGDAARLPGLVAELIARDISVLLVVGAEALRAAAAITRTLPIVALDLETNPVAAGFARSLARPGGNITGVFLDQPSLAAKWVGLLREVAPGLRRIGLIWDPSTGPDQLDAARAAAAAQGLVVTLLAWRGVDDFDAVLAPLAASGTGLVTLTAPGFAPVVGRLGAAAQRHRLPMIVFLRSYLGEAVLMSYGPDQRQHFGRAMALVERILAGEAPGDVPVELPTRFELGLDLRVARAIGVEVPMALLAQADTVLE